jgi:hypothetical protein
VKHVMIVCSYIYGGNTHVQNHNKCFWQEERSTWILAVNVRFYGNRDRPIGMWLDIIDERGRNRSSDDGGPILFYRHAGKSGTSNAARFTGGPESDQ